MVLISHAPPLRGQSTSDLEIHDGGCADDVPGSEIIVTRYQVGLIVDAAGRFVKPHF
jgi:hypothetical protein